MTGNRSEHWLGKFVPYLIYRINNQLDRILRSRLKRSGINLARWRVLAVLMDHGRMNIGEIVDRTIMEQSRVSRVVDQLEREGLACRKVSDEDSRFVEVNLTEAGEKAFHEIYPTATRHQEQALRGFSGAEIKSLLGFLERIQRNFEADR